MPVPSSHRFWAASICAFLLTARCGAQPSSPPADSPAADLPAAAPAPSDPGPVSIEMRNVRLHLDEGVILNVRHLRGAMISTKANQPPVFDDVRSYRIALASADVSLDAASLTNLMNRHVFAYEGAPLKDLEVELADGKLSQKGKMHKGVWLPFSMKASVSVADDGRLRLHAESIKALGIPATKFLDVFGLTLEDLASIEKNRGVTIKDDDLLIAAGRVLPPPDIQGRLSRAEVSGSVLRQVFGTETDPSPLPRDPNASNYVFFSGSVIRFGRLTMTNADLRLVDQDPRDVFDFYPAKYDEQLIAGYSKNLPNGGLKTFMPDYEDLRKH
jgi:hypothetical protein